MIETMGCQMNENDSEKLVSLLLEHGFDAVKDPQEADILIVNTCSVRKKAEEKFLSYMGRLKYLKKKKNLIIGVVGCIAQLEKENLLRKVPHVDFCLGPSSIHKVIEAIETVKKGQLYLDFSENGEETLCLKPSLTSKKIKAFVTIMKGCNNFCSYCVVPYARGREISRPSLEILNEIEELAKNGVKEVTLLGQNVNSYNKDRNDLSFPQLLEKVNEIPGIERIRFVTSHPKDLSEELIRCFGRLRKLCEHIHLPFQSGSNKILKLMNRGYTKEEYLEKIEMLKEVCPGIAITADCIVGFPGEEDRDFEETMDLLQKVRFHNVFSFAYSPRKFTRALLLPNQVPREKALARLRVLQEEQRKITLEKNKELEGKRVDVLVEGLSKRSSLDLTGRTRTNIVVNFGGPLELIGRTVEVLIVKGYANSVRGANIQHKSKI
ncbi:MAG: tRNA (N6-isopentenyl adenosine(37)-C2)-methylthiotransferase MiaB [Deltaproteobacteria bacterium]|nr:tRNA (N6-isopentenyl adenosine(37)-C2)-methylthiotransferase MiaB [Deltaproteobacteria bacterium]